MNVSYTRRMKYDDYTEHIMVVYDDAPNTPQNTAIDKCVDWIDDTHLKDYRTDAEYTVNENFVVDSETENGGNSGSKADVYYTVRRASGATYPLIVSGCMKNVAFSATNRLDSAIKTNVQNMVGTGSGYYTSLINCVLYLHD